MGSRVRASEPRRLDRDILAFIRRQKADPRAFNRLALRLFADQYRRNDAYRRYCLLEGATPSSVRDWRQIPAVPAEGFRRLRLTCFPAASARRVFRTSGTSVGRRGRHYFSRFTFYRAAVPGPFKRSLLPDRSRVPMYFLVESPRRRPDSSLSWMMGQVRSRFNAPPGGRYYVREGRVLTDRLHRDLGRARGPVLLLATAFSLQIFLETLQSTGRKLRLPAGSRVMETGGFKGLRRAVGRRRLYRMVARLLGVPPRQCIAEYGMTELSSQCYDANRSEGRRLKEAAPWLGWTVRDLRTGRPLPPGRTGLLCFCDLANRDSVLSVQTEDLAVARGRRFELLGRASGAPSRGCSLSHEGLRADFR